MKNSYIVLEGPDGSGTTSHAARLVNIIQNMGFKSLLTAEPTGGPIGIFTRECFRTKVKIPASALQLLFCADRAMHHEQTIKPALERGDVIISDRSLYSTLAYGDALGLDVPWLERVNEEFVHPDLLILALPPLEVCIERLNGRGVKDGLEEDSLQARVHKAYRKLADQHPEWIVIDTSGPFDETARLMEDAVNRFFASKA